jgi:DNA-binding transcriptional LysR family regulator
MQKQQMLQRPVQKRKDQGDFAVVFWKLRVTEQDRKKVTIQDICPYPLISYTKESGMRRIIDDMFTKAQIMPNILCQFEDVNSMAGLVEKNQGIAIVTDSQALRNYNVTKLELDTPYSRRMVYMAYVLNRYLPPAVEKFKDYTIQRTKTKK